MLRTEQGSRDGILVEEFQAGGSYDLPAHLAEAFLEMRAAEEDTAAHAPVETTAAAQEKPVRASRGKRARKES
jgi:hypothetical protein